jgi:hypothetical protein
VIKDVLLTHIPVPVLPQGVRINIHGHFHNNPMERVVKFEPHIGEFYDPKIHRLFAMENTNYQPVRLEEFAKGEPVYQPVTEGKLPIDERCVCGRLKSEHSPQVVSIQGSLHVEAGHGDGVNCKQFRWADFIYDENDPRPKAQGWKPN